MCRTHAQKHKMSWIVGVCLLIACAGTARAQDEPPRLPPGRLINLDTPAIVEPRTFAFAADLRVFGSREDNVYGAVEARYGLRERIEVLLRFVGGEQKAFFGPGFRINYGGRDFEAAVKYQLEELPNAAVMVGFSAPRTPAQKEVVATAQFLYHRELGSRATVYFTPKAVFVEDNPLVGIGGGASVRISDDLEAVGDITGLVAGNNTRSIFTGAKQRREVWGVVVRYTPFREQDHFSVSVGATNGMGLTTGTSLTPGLGGSTAFTLGITYRR